MSTITNEEIAALLDAHNGGSRDPWQHGQKMANALEKLAAEREWQPIETAPMGGHDDPSTHFLGGKFWKDNKGRTRVSIATCYRNKHGAYEWFGGGMTPTHWMPLPAAKEAAE